MIATPEILEKSGFTCTEHETRKEYSLGAFVLCVYPNGEITFMWNGQVTYIKSVHHLQNLIFALTGEELDVKL